MAQIFPRWTNEVPKSAPPPLAVLTTLVVFALWYWFSPEHTDVGYQPVQPIQYSHKLHAGEMKIDCRYCHTGVEVSPHAGVPPTQTCLNCHNLVLADSSEFVHLRRQKDDKGHALADVAATPWVRVHKTPDYAYFDHSAHVTVGVGCKSCHGRVDQMVKVRQENSLSMAWCLNCHRNIRHFEARGFEPADVLRPLHEVTTTDMNWPDHASYEGWKPAARDLAKKLKPPTVECSGCHR